MDKVDAIIDQIGELSPIEGQELKLKMKQRFSLHSESFPPDEVDKAPAPPVE